jgi:hypothetical protein
MKWWQHFRLPDPWDRLTPDEQRRAAIVIMVICATAIVILLFVWE